MTDANLVLGRLAPDSSLASDLELDADAASRAVESLGAKLGLDLVDAATGIVRLANAEMVRALRVVTVNRGVDPRAFALLPFGGAGPMHAAELAEDMGMNRLVCPRSGGVLSALGLIASSRRRDTARTVMLRAGDLTRETIAGLVSELRETITGGLSDATETITYEVRYEGQSFELDVEAAGEPGPQELAQGFADAHEFRYGFKVEGAGVELVAIRLALVEATPEPELKAASGSGLELGVRRVHFADGWHEAAVTRGEPAEGESFVGPAVIESPESTLILPPCWSAQVDRHGSILAVRAA